MYASLLISLLAAFVAMLGKQWLNRYLRNSGGSTIERCGDRQLKCDGLEKWPLQFFVESLPMMLQAALLLLACGLCRYMWSINASVARTLIGFTGLGVVFYVAIVIAGMSSYACPFQTPVSTGLHGSWKKARWGIVSFISGTRRIWNRRVRRRIVSSVVHFKRVLSRARRVWDRRVRSLLRRQSPPMIPLEDVQVQRFESVSTSDNTSQTESSSTSGSASRAEPWMRPMELDTIRKTNASDAQCVSWILRNITDPEALDAAIRLAGVIRWFDAAIVDVPYDVILSTFRACFDSTGSLYPGSRDRAYYSARAIRWIWVTRYKSEGLPPMGIYHTIPVPDPDLEHLLQGSYDLASSSGLTLPHLQWSSNLLLHFTWVTRTRINRGEISIEPFALPRTEATAPPSVTPNCLLTWCIILGSHVEGEALMVEDKSYDVSCLCSSGCSLLFSSGRMQQILDRLSEAVHSAVSGTSVPQFYLSCMLRDLVGLENRSVRLTKAAYNWCSMICENRERIMDWESLVLTCLEIGFRHLGLQCEPTEAWILSSEHHRGLVDVVFKGEEGEAIADLLRAWTGTSWHHSSELALLGSCAEHLVGLPNLVPFSSRLRRLVIRSIELIGYKGFEGVGVERFVGLLNHLSVAVEDMDEKTNWERLLLDTIQSSEGIQHLSHWYWEILVDLAVSGSLSLWLDCACGLQIMKSLTEAEEWTKLECWVGIVWMAREPGADEMTDEDLRRSTLLLFHQRPGAIRKLEQWMERWSHEHGEDVPELFQQICKQAGEAAKQDTL
jgi:hypothetical protein